MKREGSAPEKNLLMRFIGGRLSDLHYLWPGETPQTQYVAHYSPDYIDWSTTNKWKVC